ncbi:hypothetical protein GGX14DRAFT_397965 [Mycena pura]|uniref:Uncharacterized protein n=1 Tax=Mycena pura TaxID=153505 RepID=A0AAD6V9W8_9AGAR|nr:hypothetical protein GGX14DRAFT_397965 [Mycena pura]
MTGDPPGHLRHTQLVADGQHSLPPRALLPTCAQGHFQTPPCYSVLLYEQQQQQQQQQQPPPSLAAGWRSDAVELRTLDIRRSFMSSTTRGNPGEVICPARSASPTSKTPLTHTRPLPPFRPRPRLIRPSRLSGASVARLLLIGPRLRHPPRSSHAACARFRLAKKKSPGRQFDIATISATVTQLETHAQRVGSQIQTTQALIEAARNYIHFIHPASSSNPPPRLPNSTQLIRSILQRGLASRTTVAPPESRSRALPLPFRPFSEDAIT